jgi:hypothetical protein
MKRNKAQYLDYFVDGTILIPALFLPFDEMDTLLDAAYDGMLEFKTKRRKRGA